MVFLTQPWDLWLFTELNQHWRNALLDWLMPVLSINLLLWLLIIFFVALAAQLHGPRRALGLLLLCIVGAVLTEQAVNLTKGEIGRVRPLNAVAGAYYYEDHTWERRPPDFQQTKERGSSYPSAHAAHSMGAALLLALAVPRLRPWIFVLPLLVGYSRIYMAKHYPVDVLAGWTMGLVVTGLLWYGLMALLPPRLRPWEQD